MEKKKPVLGLRKIMNELNFPVMSQQCFFMCAIFTQKFKNLTY